MKPTVSKFTTLALAAFMAISLSVVAQGATSQTVMLTAGQAGTVSLPKAAADILVANPSIADVGSLRADKLYLVGRTVGDTNVLAFDDEGNQMADIAIHVRVEEESLRNTLHEFFPKEHVTVRTVNDSIVLTGEVSNPAAANQVRDLASRFIKTTGQTLVDLMTVRGEEQVMLKVKVIEAKRALLREMGIDTTFELGHGARNNFKFTPAGGVGLAAASEFGSGALALAQHGMIGPVSLDLQGLEQDGFINTLAEPTLTAISGETAGFLAGGEFPVPGGRDTSGNVSIEFKQFGVALNFIPTVLDSKRISLQLTSEVSEKSDTDSVTLNTGGGSTVIPGLAVRRAQTTVQMGSGGTLMIAGLMKSNTTDALNGFPGLKDLPIIGNLFKSKSFQRGESELVFLVTPYIVEPYADQQAEQVSDDDNQALDQILQQGKATSPARMPSPFVRTGSAPALLHGMPSTPSGRQDVTPQKTYYHRQGDDDERTAGEKKADATLPGLRPVQEADAGGLIGAPLAPVEEAPAPDIQPGLMLPVPKHKPVVLGDARLQAEGLPPIPKHKPVMAEPPAKLAALKTEEVTTEQLAAVEPAAGTPQLAWALPLPRHKPVMEAVKAASADVRAPVVAGSPLKLAWALPLPHRKPGMKPVVSHLAAIVEPVTEGKDGVKPLSAVFMNSLKKIYGKRVSTRLGAEASYGYIVD